MGAKMSDPVQECTERLSVLTPNENFCNKNKLIASTDHSSSTNLSSVSKNDSSAQVSSELHNKSTTRKKNRIAAKFPDPASVQSKQIPAQFSDPASVQSEQIPAQFSDPASVQSEQIPAQFPEAASVQSEQIHAQFPEAASVQSEQIPAQSTPIDTNLVTTASCVADNMEQNNAVSMPVKSVRPRYRGRNVKPKTGDKVSRSRIGQPSGKPKHSSDKLKQNITKNNNKSAIENCDEKSSCNFNVPSQVKNRLWLSVEYKNPNDEENPPNHRSKLGGNWLFFLDTSVSDVSGLSAHDEAWKRVWKMVKKGMLSYASCSTAVQNPDALKEGKGVISVYTKDCEDVEDIEAIARKVAANLKLKNTMLYKPRKASGKYVTDGEQNIATYKFAFDELYIKDEAGKFVTVNGKLYGPVKSTSDKHLTESSAEIAGVNITQ